VHAPMKPELKIPDLAEKGRNAAGEVISLDRRLFLQLLAWSGCHDHGELTAALRESLVRGALLLDLNDPQGVALVAAHESPAFFTTELRNFLNRSPFAELIPRPELTMMGRSYSIGYEADLENVLIQRPLQRVTNHDWPWQVWYPLRRKGSFEKLPREEQQAILGEHGQLGMTFSAGGFGHDIRLDCHGLDTNDNDFVIGLIGPNLYPLSAMVQAMRKTRQTSEFLERLGPFLVGQAVWQRGTKE
jgi:hypothetical protein